MIGHSVQLWRKFKVFLRWGHVSDLVTWPWVIWVRNFHKVCEKDVWTAVPKTAVLRAAFFQLSAKNLKGVFKPPPGPARVNYLYLLIINIMQFILVNKLSNFPSERCTGRELAWGANWKKLSHGYGPNLICKNLGLSCLELVGAWFRNTSFQ